jgi:phosphohistidine swiveling domain-containing protein
VNTEALPDAIPVSVEVPAGHWRREATHCPQPLSPLFRGALPAITAGFARLFAEMGVLADTLEWREIGGWVYTRVVPLGGAQTPVDPALIPERVAVSIEAVRSDRFGGYLERWHRQWRNEFMARTAEIAATDLGPVESAALASQLERALELTAQALEAHILLHGVSAVALTELAFTCRDLLGWDDARALGLLSGLSEATTAPATALAGLATLARESAGAHQFAEDGSSSTVHRLVDTDPAFGAAFAAYEAEYGLRTIRYDTMDPSVRELSSLTLRLIADQLRSGFDDGVRATEVQTHREAARAEARARLADRPVADRERFEQALDRAAAAYPVREDNGPLTVTEPLALVRRVALEIGRRLAAAGIVTNPEDVFFLEIPEVFAVLAAGPDAPVAEQRDLVRRRRAERVWVEAHPGPAVRGPNLDQPSLDDLPPEAGFMNEAFLWLLERAGHFGSALPQAAGRRLTGIGASHGTYTGRVRVLHSEADFDKLDPGAVLVCPITSPTWSMLFPNVGALVTDAGGLLSHPAIIAREFHVPAVVATGNATAHLVDGQLVTVDGTAGYVEILPGDPPAPAALS